jgi:hypothetical protein
MDWMAFLSSLAVALGFTSFIHMRKHNALKRKHKALEAQLKSLREKSYLEQDLSLATTEQLMDQVQSRVPGFILITPHASNVQNEQGLNVHIKGFPLREAISCMKFACNVIANNPPQEFGGAWEHEE